jgi:hypothetical protein
MNGELLAGTSESAVRRFSHAPGCTQIASPRTTDRSQVATGGLAAGGLRTAGVNAHSARDSRSGLGR